MGPKEGVRDNNNNGRLCHFDLSFEVINHLEVQNQEDKMSSTPT